MAFKSLGLLCPLIEFLKLPLIFVVKFLNRFNFQSVWNKRKAFVLQFHIRQIYNLVILVICYTHMVHQKSD